MPLNATAIKNYKHSGKPTGDKLFDGEGPEGHPNCPTCGQSNCSTLAMVN
jgi:hypothetical protein